MLLKVKFYIGLCINLCRFLVFTCLYEKRTFDGEDSLRNYLSNCVSKILEDQLPKILNNSQLNDSANISQKFDLLSSKMNNIKETNIDMIKLLSNREMDSFTYPIKLDNNKQLTTTITENDSSTSTRNLMGSSPIFFLF